jgi:hypothetical protein
MNRRKIMYKLEELSREAFIVNTYIEVDIKYRVNQYYYKLLEIAYRQIETEPNLHYEPIDGICRLRFRVTSKEELDNKLAELQILSSGSKVSKLQIEAAKILL